MEQRGAADGWLAKLANLANLTVLVFPGLQAGEQRIDGVLVRVVRVAIDQHRIDL